MKYLLVIIASLGFILSSGCKGAQKSDASRSGNGDLSVDADARTIIVDVRTPQEWNEDGHASCSVNYPLDQLMTKIDSIRPFEKVIVVCRSGKRAEQAREMLMEAGMTDVENKGSWTSVKCP